MEYLRHPPKSFYFSSPFSIAITDGKPYVCIARMTYFYGHDRYNCAKKYVYITTSRTKTVGAMWLVYPTLLSPAEVLQPVRKFTTR